MTLVIRERRRQQPLTLTVPPHHLNDFDTCSPLSSSTASTSPGTHCLSDFTKLSVLGWGTGGTVYKVSHIPTGDIYALKVVRSSVEAAREAEIMQKVSSSEYVVRCLGVLDRGSTTLDAVCFVMEYMDAGSLHSILCREKRLPEDTISSIVASVLKGLQHLHRLRVVHGDIKPSNILVNAKGEAKIADFGTSRIIDPQNSVSMCTTGTCEYMSPERMDPEGYCDEHWEGYAGDVWSVGVVAMECYMGRFPLVPVGEKLDWVTLMWAICSGGNAGSTVRMGSPELQSFCQRCLEREWRKRATVEELLLHPFVNKISSPATK